MTQLSVNVNKIATLRNSRGANFPNVLKVALDCVRFGADGITVHPRPDERHIKKQDVYELKEHLTVEFNIEGYPSEEFVKMVLEVKPAQVTLVPDPPNALTSNTGWKVTEKFNFLEPMLKKFNDTNIRTSIFIDPLEQEIEAAARAETQRIEFYTGPYAHEFYLGKERAVSSYKKSGILAHQLNLGINAGHDLNLDNLAYLKQNIPHLKEVSIGHALIVDALYFGLENTIQMYKAQLLKT
jgi:pyridoxine 5-phosphate synthase